MQYKKNMVKDKKKKSLSFTTKRGVTFSILTRNIRNKSIREENEYTNEPKDKTSESEAEIENINLNLQNTTSSTIDNGNNKNN